VAVESGPFGIGREMRCHVHGSPSADRPVPRVRSWRARHVARHGHRRVRQALTTMALPFALAGEMSIRIGDGSVRCVRALLAMKVHFCVVAFAGDFRVTPAQARLARRRHPFRIWALIDNGAATIVVTTWEWAVDSQSCDSNSCRRLTRRRKTKRNLR
jgi:hypothetical protein